jgi:outer membrane murein-binding lipoprotein Lpp
MTTLLRRSAGSLAGIVAVSALLLTGCTASQSTTEACTQLNAELESAGEELQSSITSMSTDPQGAIDALETFQGSLSETVDGITNEEIKTLGEDTEAALGDYIDAITAATADPQNADSEALTSAIEGFQAQAQKFSETCSS